MNEHHDQAKYFIYHQNCLQFVCLMFVLSFARAIWTFNQHPTHFKRQEIICCWRVASRVRWWLYGDGDDDDGDDDDGVGNYGVQTKTDDGDRRTASRHVAYTVYV